jgi:heptose-I-phosphate ethanolaminephosphotransferase
VFLFLFVDFYLVEKAEYIEDVLFCFSVLAIIYNGVFKKQIFLDIIYFLYVFYFILETTSYLAVSSNFSSSYMFLLIESNASELKEFSASYISIPIVLFISLMIVLFFVLRKMKIVAKGTKKKIVAGIVFFGIVAVLKGTGLIESNAYHNIVRGVYGYFELQNSVKFNANISKENIKITSDNDVLVVVLGESTTSKHMQIYGYQRETTPLLNSIKDSLYIYNNVISTDVFTLKVVPKILTSIDNDGNNYETTNIIEVFNKAGYKTYWLANQKPISYHDNATNRIASACYKHKFYNYIDDVNTSILDDVILPDYINILNEPGKKIIFIKLIGTHFDYNKRYPSNYNKFISRTNSTKKERIINYYDNAVLYNDFIIYSFIEQLKKHNNKSALLYLSDHGENVYDNTDFFGRSETLLTKSMFEIPFLVWVSKDFQLPKDFEYKPNRAFMADHTYESIGHLFGVLYSDMNVDNSIFNKSFKNRKRKVIDNIDFDSYFLKPHE